MIRWGSAISSPFKVKNGIKQGGLLSPHLFNLYIDKLSVELTASGVGCIVKNIIVNHISYADDMVLMAPSVRSLQILLNICSLYANISEILYNTEKSYCMICWPKRFLFKFIPSFYMQNDLLQFVTVYKYLGVLINQNMTDDDEMLQRMRDIYATGNMIIRKFGNCSVQIKIQMYKVFFSQVYGSSVWSTFKVSTFNRTKVSHNDIFRSLLHVPRYESATTLFAIHNVRNLNAVLRNSCYSLMCRVTDSANSIVRAIVTSEARLHSRIWDRWGIVLGRNMVEMF